MPYIVIDNFSYGLDRRRSRFAGVAGSLWDIQNGHITRGGEIERCKKFAIKYELPENTFGCFGLKDTIYVFGSVSTPMGIPSGVTYQRLQHPDGSTAMSSLLDVKPMDGKPYTIALFADGNKFHFYDGELVTDWSAGRALAYMSNLTGVAVHFKDLINANGNWTATNASNVLEVTGIDNTDWSYSVAAEDGGGTDNQQITASVAQEAVAGTAETVAIADFQVTGGSPAVASTGTVTLVTGAAGSFTSITVGGIEVLGATVPFNTSLTQTAADIAAQINSYTGDPEYTATSSGTVVTISAAQSLGAAPNGFVVVATYTVMTASTTNMASGVSSGISSVTVDGVEVLGSTINLVGSYSAFAAAVAAAITSYTSSPNYSGSSSASTVTVSAAAGSGATPNGYVVNITAVGSLTLSTASTAMAGGVAATSGQPKIVDFAFSGTFEVDDKFTITLTTADSLLTKVFGYEGSPDPVGNLLLPYQSKMYSSAESVLNFSAVNAPTVWNRDNVATALAGQGFINASSQDEGSQDITALALYQSLVAIFSRRAIQLWAVYADEALNTFVQTLQNTGTRAPRSALAFGNNDSFYLDDTGVRSLRARDSSNAAYVNDVGTAIDTIIQDRLATLTETQITRAVATLEPSDGRYWLALGEEIFVFSYFPASKISAWSIYTPGFEITDFTKLNNRVYARAGDTIYLYGGDTGLEYPDDDELPVSFVLPFLGGDKIATRKKFKGFDVGCVNQWDAYALPDPTRPDVEHHIGVFTRPTFSQPRMGMKFVSTHVGIRMTCTRGGYASVANAAIHYDDLHAAG